MVAFASESDMQPSLAFGDYVACTMDYIGSRYYAATLGRFVSRDPIGYPRLLRLHNLSDAEIAQYVDDIRNAAAIADPSPGEIVSVVKSDADDDYIIATAVLSATRKFFAPGIGIF